MKLACGMKMFTFLSVVINIQGPWIPGELISMQTHTQTLKIVFKL